MEFCEKLSLGINFAMRDETCTNYFVKNGKLSLGVKFCETFLQLLIQKCSSIVYGILVVYKWKLYCVPNTYCTTRKQTKTQEDKAIDIEGSGVCAFPLKKIEKQKREGKGSGAY
jgi:hypothetical protein